MSSSTKRQQTFLGSRHQHAKVRELLTDWVNIPTDYFEGAKVGSKPDAVVIRRIDAAIKRLRAHYPEIFTIRPLGPRPPDAESEITSNQWRLAAQVQDYLRRAWEASDLRSREWFIFKARDYYHFQTVVMPLFDVRMRSAHERGADLKAELDSPVPDEEEAVRHGPPRLTEFERAMYLFQRIADQARRCPNPECPAPFFFTSRKNQRYCGEKCAAEALREQKRKWWAENHSKRRGGDSQ